MRPSANGCLCRVQAFGNCDGTPRCSVSASPPPVIAGGGTPEKVWLAWPGLAQFKNATLPALCAARSRLVVLAPHPDDEILACGGLIALHLDAGGELLIVSASDGEASHRSSLAHSRDRYRQEAALAKTRRQERTSGTPEEVYCCP